MVAWLGLELTGSEFEATDRWVVVVVGRMSREGGENQTRKE